MTSVTRRHFLVGTLAAGLSTTVLSACSSGGGTGSSGGGGESVLRVGALGKVANAQRDPHKSLANDSDMLIASLIYEPMTVPGAEQTVVPRVMESWEQTSPTGWRFTLAPDVTFHDGTPVTAEDAVWSFQRLLADEANEFKLPVVPDSIKADGDNVVLFETPAPNSQLPLLVRLMTFVMKKDSTPEDAMGSGPFVLESWTNGSARLKANKEFHLGAPGVDVIEVVPFEDSAAMTNAVLSGQIDLAQSVGAVAARSAEGKSNLHILRRSSDYVIPLVMRAKDGPFADVRVRQAMRLAVDRQALVDGALSGYGSTANDVLGTRDPEIDASLTRKQDLVKAKKLLSEANFDTSKTYPLYVTPEAPGQLDAMKLIATQLKEVGVKVEVTEQESGKFYDETWTKADLYSTYWGTNDSVLFFAGKVLESEASANETAFDDKEFDGTWKKLLESNDDNEIAELSAKLQKIEFERGGYLVWGAADAVDIAAEGVSGVPTAPGYGRVLLETVKKN